MTAVTTRQGWPRLISSALSVPAPSATTARYGDPESRKIFGLA